MALLALLTVGGCSRSDSSDVAEASESAAPGPEAVAFANAYASPRRLGEAVLEAIRENDPDALNRLRVTREEHLTLFWPELPESDDTPFDFAWQLNDDRSRTGVRQAMAQFGGQEFELIELTFTEPPEVYPDFTVYFGAQLRARRAADGKVGYLPILDVVVERRGFWKLLNVRED